MFYSLVIVLLSPGLIWAANLRDLAKSIYVGTAVNSGHLNDDRYNEMTGQQFNMLTAEWEMKWSENEKERGNFDYTLGDKLATYAQEHDMRIRGHTLVWHEQVPDWVNGLDKDALHGAMIDRINNAMEHYKGKIYAWDVVNEVFEDSGELRKSIFFNNFGESFISDSFRAAKKADPNAKLYINDYSIEGINSKSTGLYNLVKKLKDEGVPIEGVGFQSHFTIGNVPKDFEENLKRFTALGVDVAITELTVAKNNEGDKLDADQQGKDYAKVFQICENVDRCVGVTVWGWTDKYCFNTNLELCMWDVNFNPKPAVQDVENVLH